jgi:hypothetical protein
MPDPLRLWSVTTLVKLGMGTSDPLVNWAVGTTAEYALDNGAAISSLLASGDRAGAKELLTRARYRSSGAAKARGSELHAAAEKLALGVSPEVDVKILPYVEQYKRFLEEHAPVFEMAEAPVYSPTRFYAGTLDGIIVLEGQRLVFDIKTTDRGPDSEKSRPPYAEVALQLAAYRRAELVGVLSEQRYASGKRYYLFDPEAEHQPMPETDGAVCIVVSPFDYTITPVRTDDEVFKCFIAARECARFNVDVSRRVFGPQITTKAAA